MFPGNTGSCYCSYQTFQNCVLQSTCVLWDFNRWFMKKAVLTSSLKCCELFPFCRFSMYIIILKVLRCYAVKTLVRSHLIPQSPNLFDDVTLLWFFWREKMVVGAQTHFENFQRLLSWKYHVDYWKFLKYQYHITEQKPKDCISRQEKPVTHGIFK